MRNSRKTPFIAVLVAGVLASCQPATLIQLNNEYIDLVRAEQEAIQAKNLGELAETNYTAAREGLRVRFAATGDMAVEAANAAEKPANKASFLNAAVRSYLKSGAVADTKIPQLAQDGIGACSNLTGLNALPVTCGYFHIVEAQAISNEARRSYETLSAKAANARRERKSLPPSDGKVLVKNFNAYTTALEILDKNRGKIDFNTADSEFRVIFIRQENLIFCNVGDTESLMADVASTGDDWNRKAEEGRMLETLKLWKQKLSARSGGFDENFCSRRNNASMP